MSYHRQKNQRITGKHPDECPACEGLGQTRASETVMVEVLDILANKKRLVTARDPITQRPKCGSGCLKCGGVGRLTHIRRPPTGEELQELRERLLGPSANDLFRELAALQ